MASRQYYVYILTNKARTVLYVGVTNNLERRLCEHKNGKGGAFTKRYNVHALVYFEVTPDAYTTISREKQLKAGSRQKKIDSIESMNPQWKDLSIDF